jgi:Holliday junction resolvasome RuvABC endonuclease subunit
MGRIRRIAGIDYSLTSPSVCVYEGEIEKMKFDGCKVYFLSNTKKFSDYNYKNIDGQENLSSFVTAEERYDFISDWAMDILISHEVEEVFLEDYSYGSTGKVFHIAENCGLLKYKMWQADIKVTLVAPTQIKKFATGKGNAKKELMYQSFFDETSRNLIEEFSQKSEKIGNPISDVVDSYFICKYSTSI